MTISNKDKTEMTIVVGSIEIPMNTIRIMRTMDTASDGWTSSFAWFPGKDQKIDEVTLQYSYHNAKAYIGNELIVSGRLYNTEHINGIFGRSKNLEGFSFTADIIDSSVPSPYEKNNISLIERAEQLCNPHGILVEIDSDVDIEDDIEEKFNRVTATQGQKIFEHLLGLAKIRGVLLSSTPDGQLLITSAKTKGDSIGTIEEGDPIVQSLGMRFDGRARFGTYKAVSNSPLSEQSTHHAIEKDNAVPQGRVLTFFEHHGKLKELRRGAKNKKNKTAAQSMTLPFPVTTWYGPDNKLWKENTLLTVVSPTIGLGIKGFTFLIRSVEFALDETGRTATLGLVPPTVYTNEKLIEPWSAKSGAHSGH